MNCTPANGEGSFTACELYILKLGNAFGGLLAGMVIKWAGFIHGQQEQSPQTIFWFRSMLAAIPVAGLILVILFILRFNLTKQKCREIRTVLEQRRRHSVRSARERLCSTVILTMPTRNT